MLACIAMAESVESIFLTWSLLASVHELQALERVGKYYLIKNDFTLQ